MGAGEAACFIEIQSKGRSDDAHEEESHNCWTECTLWRGERWESVYEEGGGECLEITKKIESANRGPWIRLKRRWAEQSGNGSVPAKMGAGRAEKDGRRWEEIGKMTQRGENERGNASIRSE